jgi:hypothetical protein
MCYYSRYQKRCDELEVNRGNNNDKFEQLEKQKNDIVDYLKKEINKKSKLKLKKKMLLEKVINAK